MANNPQFSDATVIAGVAAAVAVLNSGGTLQILTGSQPADANQALTGTLLATLTFSSTAFGTPTASGSTGSRVVTAAANAISSATAAASGTAGYFALVKADGVTVAAMGSVGTSGADLNLNSLSITSGATVSCSSFTVTQPET
jgi:hypothetical protein